MIRLLLTLIIGFFFSLSSLHAQTPKYANAFLDIGVGARALGMSNAVVASAGDITCGYWNPAGLNFMQKDFQGAFMHNEHFAGIVKYDYASIGMRFTPQHAGAFSFIRSGVDNIPNTLELIDANGNVDYDRIKSFSVADYAFLLSYSYAFKDRLKGLSIGTTAKIIHRHIGEFGNGWGFGFDLGIRYTRKNWFFAAMLRDATTTITNFSYQVDQFRLVFSATGNEIISSSTEIAVPRLILGGAKKFNFGKKFSLLTELNIAMTTDGRRNVLIPAGPVSFDPAVGIEAEYNDIVFIRGGVGKFQYLKNEKNGKDITLLPTLGLGFKYWGVCIDYTLANFGNQIVGLSHVFSVRIEIAKPGKKYGDL